MGIYNEFYVFNNKSVIPETEFCIYNRAVGIFCSENIHNFKPNEEYVIDYSLITRLLQAYEDGTLKRSPLTNPRNPLLFPDEVAQLCDIKHYLRDRFKVVYRQID